MAQEDVFKKLVSHCKEYGFVFPSSDIYDGLGAVYDYGQMGVELKNNIKKYWWDSMVLLHENIVGIDSFRHTKARNRKRRDGHGWNVGTVFCHRAASGLPGCPAGEAAGPF